MLKDQLEQHGFEGIEIAFDAPTREWSSQLSHPAISLFLYDMREAEEHRPSGWTKQRVGDEWVEAPPPLVMEVSYAITAWAQAVEDEHRLLSQVLAVLYAFPELPQEMLNGRLRNGSQPTSIKARVGQAKGDKADFWTAVGRPVQGLAGLRRAALRGVRGQAPDPPGPDTDHPHADDRRTALRGGRDAPHRRHDRRRRRRAAGQRVGHAARTPGAGLPRAPDGRFLLRPSDARPAPTAGPDGRRPRGRGRPRGPRRDAGHRPRRTARPARAAAGAASADDRTGRRPCPNGSCP